MEHISACSGPRSTPHQSLTFTAGKQLLGHATLTHFVMQEWAVLGRVFFGETSQAAKHTEKYRAQRRLCRHPDTSGITQLPGFASAKGQIRENNEKAEQKRFCFNHWLVPRRATVPSNTTGCCWSKRERSDTEYIRVKLFGEGRKPISSCIACRISAVHTFLKHNTLGSKEPTQMQQLEAFILCINEWESQQYLEENYTQLVFE